MRTVAQQEQALREVFGRCPHTADDAPTNRLLDDKGNVVADILACEPCTWERLKKLASEAR